MHPIRANVREWEEGRSLHLLDRRTDERSDVHHQYSSFPFTFPRRELAQLIYAAQGERRSRSRSFAVCRSQSVGRSVVRWVAVASSPTTLSDSQPCARPPESPFPSIFHGRRRRRGEVTSCLVKTIGGGKVRKKRGRGGREGGTDRGMAANGRQNVRFHRRHARSFRLSPVVQFRRRRWRLRRGASLPSLLLPSLIRVNSSKCSRI